MLAGEFSKPLGFGEAPDRLTLRLDADPALLVGREGKGGARQDRQDEVGCDPLPN